MIEILDLMPPKSLNPKECLLNRQRTNGVKIRLRILTMTNSMRKHRLADVEGINEKEHASENELQSHTI